MDFSSIIIGAISLLFCIIPFALMYYIRIKKENKMLQSLNAVAQLHNCRISQHEFCGDFVLGLDENTNFVFFFKQKKNESITQFVDLSEIQTCQAVKQARSSARKDGNVSITEKIEMRYIPTNKGKTETRFELYIDDSSQLSGELQFVDKWSKQINDRISIKK